MTQGGPFKRSSGAEMSVTRESTLTCPACGVAKAEIMPTDACQYFYECTSCGTLLRPKPGDCCVFCSYGTVPCPPIQEDRDSAAHTPAAADAPWPFCALDSDAFGERLAEIDSLVRRFQGRARDTAEGLELVFDVRDGLRPA